MPPICDGEGPAAPWRRYRPCYLLDVAEHDRGHAEVGDARVASDRLLRHLERVFEGGGGFEAEPVDHVALAADDDDVAGVLHCKRGPVPRIERVGAVVRVRLPVKLPEPRG